MANLLNVDLFAEDRAHEAFLDALIRRLFGEADMKTVIRHRSPLGGHGKMLTELEVFQKIIRGGQPGIDVPDILVVARDANCQRFTQARQAVHGLIDQRVFPAFAIARPDPHIERWFLADPVSFHQVIGVQTRPGRRKCERNLSKRKLAEAIRKGGHPPTLGGIEFAAELVGAMDLYRGGRNEPSLQHFIDDFRQAAILVRRE
jgi:hypothetical protein